MNRLPGIALAPIATIAAIVAALSAQGAPAQPPSDPFAIAMVRGDGSLIPFARFDGEGWTPIGEASPAADRWHVWLLDDPRVKTAPFEPRRPWPVTAANTSGPCRQIKGAGLPTAGSPADVIGVASTTPAQGLDLLTALPPDSPLGRWIAERAAPSFHRAEDETLTVETDELPPGFPGFGARQKMPITWTRIVRHGPARASARTFYLEGRKEYEGFTGRLDIGRIRTTGHVFIQFAGDRMTTDAEVDLSDLEGRQSLFRMAVAVLPLGERNAWLFDVRGYAEHSYDIIELAGPAQRPQSRVRAPAGGC